MNKILISIFLPILLTACKSSDNKSKNPHPPSSQSAEKVTNENSTFALWESKQYKSNSSENLSENRLEDSTNVTSSCRSNQLNSYYSKTKSLGGNTYRPYFSQANSVEGKVHLSAHKIFNQVQKMIPTAQKQILFQTWSFQANTDPAKALFKGLAKLQRRLWKSGRKGHPVHVWMLINTLPWEDKNQKVEELFKLKRKYKIAKAYIKFHIGIWETASFAASHAKSLSIDNKVVLLTGANITKKNNFHSSYFDLGFSLKGSVVSQINDNFRKAWALTKEKDADCNSHSNMGGGFGQAEQLNCWNAVKKYPRKLRTLKAKAGSCTPVLVVQNAAQASPFRSIQQSSQNKALLMAIRDAQDSIDILTPNLNVPSVIEALLSAARRGVRVRVVLSKGHEATKEDLPTRGGSNQNTLNKMASMINRTICSSLSVRWYSNNGRRAVYGSGPPNSHAKYILIDDRITYIGSANLDMQSWVNSRELGVLIDDSKTSVSWKKQAFLPVYNRSIATGLCR